MHIGVEVQLHAFFISELDGLVTIFILLSRCVAKTFSGTHWLKSWLHSAGSLDFVAKRKFVTAGNRTLVFHFY
jgi:hypothetical protein